MKPLTWIVILYNRKWQKNLDKIVAEMGAISKQHDSAPAIPDEHILTKNDIMKFIDSQPTHLANKFNPRPRRSHKRRRYTMHK